LKPIFQAIAARVADGTPCCDWIGPGVSGRFVKYESNTSKCAFAAGRSVPNGLKFDSW